MNPPTEQIGSTQQNTLSLFKCVERSSNSSFFFNTLIVMRKVGNYQQLSSARKTNMKSQITSSIKASTTSFSKCPSLLSENDVSDTSSEATSAGACCDSVADDRTHIELARQDDEPNANKHFISVIRKSAENTRRENHRITEQEEEFGWFVSLDPHSLHVSKLSWISKTKSSAPQLDKKSGDQSHETQSFLPPHLQFHLASSSPKLHGMGQSNRYSMPPPSHHSCPLLTNGGKVYPNSRNVKFRRNTLNTSSGWPSVPL